MNRLRRVSEVNACLFTMVLLFGWAGAPLGCSRELKYVNIGDTDSDTPQTRDSDSEGDPSTVADWNGNGRDFCDELQEKFIDCGLISSGDFGCTGPSNARGACLYDCIQASPCDQLVDYVCGILARSPLEACADSCYDAEAFYCANGEERILAAWQCDGETDCSDGSDETGCTDFRCDSGESVPQARQCDTYEDCLDGSDEQSCPSFTCDDAQSIPAHWACDYYPDCADGSDERDCDGFNCGSGEVVDAMWVCDYQSDCADGSDEAECTGFECADGQIIADSWECDYYVDCDDGSDEENCTGFDCGDGYTVPASWECDTQPDCPDGSDEHAGCAALLCPA